MKHIADVIAQASNPALRAARKQNEDLRAENARLRTAIRGAVEAYDSNKRGSAQHFRRAMDRLRGIAAQTIVKGEQASD